MTGYGLTLTCWDLYRAAKDLFSATCQRDYSDAVDRLREAVLKAERSHDPSKPRPPETYPGPSNTETEGARPRRAEQGRVETVLLKDTPFNPAAPGGPYQPQVDPNSDEALEVLARGRAINLAKKAEGKKP